MGKILIISINGDQSTDNVLDWLRYLGKDVKRLNTEDLLSHDLVLSNDKNDAIDGELLSSFDSVWYRRSLVNTTDLDKKISDPKIRQQMVNHSYREKNATLKSFYAALENADWLSSPKTSSINKYEVLRKAKDVGLLLPASIITTKKSELLSFHQKHHPVIVKNVGDSESFSLNNSNYITYTSVVDDRFLDDLPEQFFPCMFQEKVDKKFEIRVFHLDGQNYSMAIFSQKDAQTAVDFRKYNSDVPNRTVPFQLPEDIDTKVNALMSSLQLQTGSLDFMYSTDGGYYFLEVNPVGQFGMVSAPCNYNLEKRIAQYLSK